MRHYYVLNLNPRAAEVFEFIKAHKLTCEVHLNRTRFWVPLDSSLNTYFQLWLSESCGSVDPTLDLATGLPISSQ